MANLPLATTSAASGISSQYDTLGRSHKYDDMEIYSTFRWDTDTIEIIRALELEAGVVSHNLVQI